MILLPARIPPIQRQNKVISLVKKTHKKKTRVKKLKQRSSLIFFGLGLVAIAAFLFVASGIVKPPLIIRGENNETLGFKDLLPTPLPYPVKNGSLEFPELSAKSVVILDIGSSVLLYQKDPDLRLLPASTTKIMTALVALESYSLGEVLTVGDSKTEGNKIKLIAGEQITVENLLYGLLVGSGNDAALVLAERFPGGVASFVSAMNKKASDLKLNDTHFTNPIGFDEEGHYSTAGDLARLAWVALKNKTFTNIVAQPEVTVTDVSGKIIHEFKNTNELVGKIDGVRGVKTGWTQNAGECLVSFIERNGEKIIIVLLGSDDRFGETRKIIDWVFNNYEWRVISPPNFQ